MKIDISGHELEDLLDYQFSLIKREIRSEMEAIESRKDYQEIEDKFLDAQSKIQDLQNSNDALKAANDALRKENAVLKQKLAEKDAKRDIKISSLRSDNKKLKSQVGQMSWLKSLDKLDNSPSNSNIKLD